MGLMSDRLHDYLQRNNVSVLVGDSRNLRRNEESESEEATPGASSYGEAIMSTLGKLADNAVSDPLSSALTMINPALFIGEVAESMSPGAVNFSSDKGVLGNIMEGYKLGGRIVKAGTGQLLDSTAGTIGYGIHRFLPNSGMDNTIGAAGRAIGDYGRDMEKRNDPHIENPDDSLAIDAANILSEVGVSLPTSLAIGAAGAGIGGAAVRGGAAILSKIPAAASAISKVTGFVDGMGNTLRSLPVVGRVARQIGLPSPANVVGGVSSGLIEGSVEGYAASQQ